MSRPRLIALLLALGTLVVFSPTIRFGFVNFDDADYVTNNPFVKPGLTLAGIQQAFVTFHAGNWHPLTWISHMTDCSLFGLNPGAHHFVNVLFHAANAALLFTLLWRLAGKIWPAAFVTALFAWHPLHVESVAWIAERKDVLSTFFALLALLSYARFAQENSRRHFWLALLCFALGLLAKPMLVTLPFVMLLLDFWPLQRFQASDFRFQALSEKAPFFLLSAASCAVTFLAQHQAIVPLEKVSLGYRLENTPVAIAGYLGQMLWPANLCAFYPMPEKIPALNIFLSLAALLLISAAAWRGRQTRPYFLTGWLWFLGTLVPVIGLVQVGGQAMADRYTYIPSIGFFIALVFLADEFAERLQTPKIIRGGVAGLMACACILATEKQLPFWRDSETLFRRAAEVTHNNDIALINLGVALNAQGRFEEALAVYRQAEALGSHRYQVYNNLGNVLRILGRPAESLAGYRKAIALSPGNAALHFAAANQLAALRRFDEALPEFFTAVQLNPNDAALHVDTAKVFFKLGRDTDGLNEFSTALRLAPENFTISATIAHYLAANENAAYRDGQSALALARKADELSGHRQPMVADILGMACADTGDFAGAQASAAHALELAEAVKLKDAEAIRHRLELYRNHQPWRESFRATNAPEKN